MHLLQIDINKIPVWIIIIALFIFIVLLAVALITGREVNIWQIKIGGKNENQNADPNKPKIDQHPDQPIVGIDKFLNEVIQDEMIRTQTLDLINELKNLKPKKSALFQEAISVDFSEFLTEVKNWTRSSVKLQGSENDNFLIKIYRHANQSVFSTCIMDYFNAWKSDFGEKLLEAHRNNQNCKTTRIFIFHDKNDITEDVMAFIKKQIEFNVTPIILLDELSEFDDFTIIDGGEVIGITNEMKFGKRLTTWYFNEENQQKRFLNLREIILNRATPVH
jgi:hypothetical protein